MSADPAQLRQRLATYVDPILGTDLASAGCLRQLDLEDGALRLELDLPFPAARYREELRNALAAHLGVPVVLEISTRIESQAVQGQLQPLPGIRNTIAVASGKGGVGKSTVTANLALALAAEGARVGVLDADIYGPSQPRMLGVSGQRPEVVDNKYMRPLPALGLVLMSIGLLVDEEEPTVWRGPMVTQALHQLLTETRWPELDYLIIDMPPGTGDIQLSLAQRIPVSGAVIVTTPQDIALLDARKGLRMFQKVEIAVLGIVENMSQHLCSNCGHIEPIFGSGGGERMAQQYHVPLLGQLPLAAKIRAQADGGRPTVAAEPDSPEARAYRHMALRAVAGLAGIAQDDFPEIIVDD